MGKHPPLDRASAIDSATNIRLVPPFQEKKVDKYLAHFEKVADSLNWPKDGWVLLLQSALVGKAQEIYGSQSVEQSSNYEHVIEAILKAYELVPEAYRQKFSNYLKYDSKTHVEFAREKKKFNESENSKGVIVKPLIDQNNFVEENKGIKVNPFNDVKSCIKDKISPDTESDYMENYKPFISEGVVLLVGDESSSQKVKILRDTGATQSLMLDSVVNLTENSFTGANVLISQVEIPLHEVNIKSSLINGNIVIGMRPSLPVEGISLTWK